MAFLVFAAHMQQLGFGWKTYTLYLKDWQTIYSRQNRLYHASVFDKLICTLLSHAFNTFTQSHFNPLVLHKHGCID